MMFSDPPVRTMPATVHAKPTPTASSGSSEPDSLRNTSASTTTNPTAAMGSRLIRSALRLLTISTRSTGMPVRRTA